MFLRDLSPAAKNGLILAGIALGGLVVWSLAGVIAPFLVSLVVGYILNPPVRWLERRGLARPWAVLALYVAGGIMGILVVVPLGLLIVNEGQELVHRLSAVDMGQLTQQYRAQVTGLIDRATSDPAWRDSLNAWLSQERLQSLAAQVAITGKNLLAGGVQGAFGFLLSAFSSVMALVLIPLLTFYVLMDMDLLYDKAVLLVPPVYRDSWQRIARDIDVQLGSLLRGQLLAALLFALMMAAGLWVAGLSFAIFLGPVAGAANLVPYLGGLSTVVMSLVVALSQFGLSEAFVWMMVKVAMVLSLVQAIDGFILQPKVIGETAGLHPLAVMLALLVGGSLFGFAGMILAVPVTCILKVVTRELYHELYDQS
ncbi:MAG: AI-2E family transporter [Candidatus Riflebacteria bacterium]|nr:AI-2E family transporter [Candidatus Riflebacteria bacterium]